MVSIVPRQMLHELHGRNTPINMDDTSLRVLQQIRILRMVSIHKSRVLQKIIMESMRMYRAQPQLVLRV